jgi:hypothetical protein
VDARIFQVDAFATERFSGNPAAVMLLDGYPEDHVLQALAAENNLAEPSWWRTGWLSHPLVHADRRGSAVRPCPREAGSDRNA